MTDSIINGIKLDKSSEKYIIKSFKNRKINKNRSKNNKNKNLKWLLKD